MEQHIVRYSKFLSLILRHKPQRIALTLDANGWADVDELIAKANADGVKITHALLQEVVAKNDKQRFKLSEDGRRIRASQGHSLQIDLELQPAQPPERLYHGTAERFLDSIRAQGLLPGNRQHVHLSMDVETAAKVGRRHGYPVVLEVKAGELYVAGQNFYLSDNQVWLTARVPPKFLIFPAGPDRSD